MSRLIDRYVLLSLSHDTADLSTIASWVRPREEIVTSLAHWKAALDVDELLYLATCNRVCVLAATNGGQNIYTMIDRLGSLIEGKIPAPWRVHYGEEAVDAVFRLAAGLQSAVLGEAEIAVQMEMAWRRARKARTSLFLIDALLRYALKAAEAARLHDGLAPSLADSIVPALTAQAGAGAVALFGRSSLTFRCAAVLRGAGRQILAVSRVGDRAQSFAASIQARAFTLQEFIADPPPLAAIISAMGGTSPLLTAEALMRVESVSGTRPVVFDLGVPPNFADEATSLLGARYYGMERLMAGAKGQALPLGARASFVAEEAQSFRQHLAQREAGPLLGAWRKARLQHVAAGRDPAETHAEILRLKTLAARNGVKGLLDHLREAAA